MRGDFSRLSRCVRPITGEGGGLPRAKPLKYAYEKEIVLYAYFKQLDYFSTECCYSKDAFRGHARTLVKDLERNDPGTILNIVETFDELDFSPLSDHTHTPALSTCVKCGYFTSKEYCMACVLLQGLNEGLPRLGLEKESKQKGHMSVKDTDNPEILIRLPPQDV